MIFILAIYMPVEYSRANFRKCYISSANFF